MNDIRLPVQEDSFASNHAGTQDIFTMDFSEDSTYIWLRNEARSFSCKPCRRALVQRNLPACMVQEDCGEQTTY